MSIFGWKRQHVPGTSESHSDAASNELAPCKIEIRMQLRVQLDSTLPEEFANIALDPKYLSVGSLRSFDISHWKL